MVVLQSYVKVLSDVFNGAVSHIIVFIVIVVIIRNIIGNVGGTTIVFGAYGLIWRVF
jgi:hypothetical protein